MKSIVYFSLVVALAALPTRAFAAQKQLADFKLAPGEKKSVSVDATKPRKIGFTTDISIEEAQKCQHSCVKMIPAAHTGFEVSSAFGTSQEVDPANGKIEVVIENMETFPIPVKVFVE